MGRKIKEDTRLSGEGRWGNLEVIERMDVIKMYYTTFSNNSKNKSNLSKNPVCATTTTTNSEII